MLGLKGNQPTFCSDMALYFSDPQVQKEMEFHKTLEKNRNRLERRICRKLTDLSWLEYREEWSGLKCVFSLERIVDTGQKRTHEIEYYISSLDVSAERLMEIAREHGKSNPCIGCLM